MFGYYFLLHIVFHRDISLKTLFYWDLSLTLVRAITFCAGYYSEFGFKINLRSRDVLKPVINFSLMVYFSSLINFLYLRLDFWLTEKKLGLVALGIYAVASGLGQFLTLIPMTLNTVMLPHLSAVDAKGALHKLRLFSSLSATAVISLATILILFASPIIHLLYGDSFKNAVLPLRIVTLSFLFLSFKHLFVFYNISQNRARKNIEAEIGGLVVGVSLNLALMPSLGTVGASIASLCANGFAFLYIFCGISLGKEVRRYHFFTLRLSEIKSLGRSLFPVKQA